jgi:MFS family permease
LNAPDHQRSVLHHLHDGHPFEAWARIRPSLEPDTLGESGAPPLAQHIVFASAVVMAALISVDLTIVNVALPSIVGELGGGIETAQWVASVYSLSYAVALLPAGRLSDAVGHRRMFLRGSIVYAVGSLLAALAPTAMVVIAARAVQGVGAAMLAPTVTALIARVYPPGRREVTLGISAGVLAVASGLGPLVGGALTDAFGWRWVFGIGVVLSPLPLLGMAVVPAAVDRPASNGFPEFRSWRRVLCMRGGEAAGQRAAGIPRCRWA